MSEALEHTGKDQHDQRALNFVTEDGRAHVPIERLLDRQEAKETIGPSGAWYQLELQAFWDSPREPDGVLRVSGAIDDGKGWRANGTLHR